MKRASKWTDSATQTSKCLYIANKCIISNKYAKNMDYTSKSGYFALSENVSMHHLTLFLVSSRLRDTELFIFS